MSDFEETKNERVNPPSDLNDTEALRDYGRQLAIDSLIADLKPAEVVEFPNKNWSRRSWLSASAASIAGIAGFALWRFNRPSPTGGNQLVALDPRWILEAAKGADFEILGSNHVKLLSGEIRLTSRESAEMLVETPFARAVAMGTDFLIGSHDPKPSTQNQKTMNTKTLTRLLVLTGSVTLATAQGEKTAKAKEAIVAQADQPPEKIVVDANSSFAFDFYSHLSGENEGENLFFSPYSMSNALMMLAEGARGETALEMGKVLGFPEALLRYGNDAQKIPWEFGIMRVGQGRLNELLGDNSKNSAEQVKAREEVAGFLKKRDEFAAKAEEETKNGDRRAAMKARRQVQRFDFFVSQARKKIDTLTLRLANAVWADRTANLQDDWKKIVSGSYGAGSVREGDFVGAHEAERAWINAWVEEQTEGRIKNLFSEDSISSATRMVLANAIYFKGDWLNPFPEGSTDEDAFTLSSGETTPVQMMMKSRDEFAKYAAFNGDGSLFRTPLKVPRQGEQPPTYPGERGFTMVEMPYQGAKASMVVIAPNDPKGLPALEKMLSASQVSGWIDSLQQRETRIRLPKFKMAASYDLRETLSSMGMPSAFSADQANFTGISESDELYVGAAVHQSFIEVNEKGTEAAAATGAALDGRSMSKEVPFVPVFNADRSFVYLIRDIESGAILFMGRVTNPGA